MDKILEHLLLFGARSVILFVILIVAAKTWNKLIQSPYTLKFRLRHQDYAATLCKMYLEDEKTCTKYFIVQFMGLKFKDYLVLRIPRSRPPIEVPFHVEVDWSVPKRPYMQAQLLNPRYDDEVDPDDVEFKVEIEEANSK